MDKMTPEQLRRLYLSDKTLFIELANKWYTEDPEYYNTNVYPLLYPTSITSKKNAKSNTNRNILIVLSVIMVVFTIIIAVINNKNKIKKQNSDTTSTVVTNIPKSDYELGIESGNAGYFNAAIIYLSKIDKNNSNYESAQKKIKDYKSYIESEDKIKKDKEKKKKEITNKYEKLMNSGLYLYEIEERLQRDGFKMTDSKFEKAPDGSTSVRQYFRKQVYGLTIDIWLQSGYSISSYYTNVDVYSD